MSNEQIEKIESGNYVIVPKWEYYLRYATLLGVIIVLVKIGSWSGNIKETISTHKENKDIHRGLKEDQVEFFTRREYDLLFNAIKRIEFNVQNIKDKIK